jgi:hypothetical protein
VTQGLSLHPNRRHESAPDFARDLEQAWRRSTLGRWLAQKDFTGTFDAQRRAEEVPVSEYVELARSLGG